MRALMRSGSKKIPASARALLVAATACLVLGCSGSGGDGGEGPAGPGPNPVNDPVSPPAASASVAMTMTGDGYGAEAGRFSPANVTVTPSGTVTWSNATSVVHNVTFTTAGAPENITNMANGAAQRVFPTAGTFGFHCTNHAGMEGTVTVRN